MLGNKVEDSSNQAPYDIENAYIVASKKVEDSSNQAPDDKENADIATSIKESLDGLSPLSRHCCIYNVPERLRWVKRPAYTPHVVSIGPLHHNKGNKDNKGKKDNKDDQNLLYMEEHKQRYLPHFLRRTGVELEVYVKKIKDQDEELRGCYDEKAKGFKRDEFVTIILVDAAFIIELLLRYYFKDLRDDDDWIFNKPWMLQNIVPDMILLENQLPFFILEDLFADVKSKWEKDERLPSIIELSYKFFHETVRLQGNKGHLEDIISSSLEVKHFVDLIRTLQLPDILKSSQTGGPTSSCSSNKSQSERPLESTLNTACTKKLHQVGRTLNTSCAKKLHQAGRTLNTPCAKKLHQAGVKLQVSSNKNLFDINFNKGILEIPQLEIHDYTELILRNLLAFEQCHCTEENHIRDYLRFMDGIVNTPMDVDLLVEYGIVVNTLGDNNNVSNLINKLCIGVSWNNENYYFAELSKKLNNYCGKLWNKSKASLKQKYFNTPWAMISVFAAGFLIVLTIIQTVCSIISVIN